MLASGSSSSGSGSEAETASSSDCSPPSAESYPTSPGPTDTRDDQPWATPIRSHEAEGYQRRGEFVPSLKTEVLWGTPTASEGSDKRGSTMLGKGAEGSPGLGEQVRNWATPTRTDAKASGSRALDPSKTAHPGLMLTDMAVRGRTYDSDSERQWATPVSTRQSSSPDYEAERETSGPGRQGPSLASQAQQAVDAATLFPTPTRTAYGSSGNGCPGDGRAAYAHAGTPSLDGTVRERGKGGALNSEWVLRLMGLPEGWLGPPPVKEPRQRKAKPESKPKRRAARAPKRAAGPVPIANEPASASSSGPPAAAESSTPGSLPE